MQGYRFTVTRKDDPFKQDVVWIFANNPHTAATKAQQWYDWKIGQRIPTEPFNPDKAMIVKNPSKVEPRRKDLVLRQFEIGIVLVDGTHISGITWGRDAGDAKAFFRVHGIIPYNWDQVKGFGYCKRKDA